MTSPTLEPFDGPPPPAPRPIAKTLSSRPRQHVQLPMPQQPPQQPPQYHPQHQQQQQHPSQHPQQTKRAQEHYDSSLDFFSSLEGTLSGLSHQSSMSSPVSSSLAPSTQSKQPTQLPAFPSSDYSVFARTSTINKATLVSYSAQQPSGKNVSSALDDASTPPVSLFTTTAPMTPFDFSASRASATAAAASVTPATLSEPTSSVTFQRKNRDSHPFQPSSSSISVPAPTSAGDLKPTLSTSSSMPSEWALATPTARISLTSSSVLTPLPSKAPPKIPARILNTPQNPIPLPSQSSGSRSYLTPQASKQSQQPSSRRSASSHIPQDSLAQDLRLQEAALDPMPQPAQRKSHALPPPPPPSQVSTSSLPVAEVTPSPWEDDEDFYRPAPPPPPPSQMTAAPSRKPSPIPPTTHAQPQPQPQSQSQSQAQAQPQPQPQAQSQQKQRKKQHQQQQQQPSDKALKQAPPSPLSPKELRQGVANGSSPSSTSVASTSDSITPYPPPPPLILYSDDQITISSLHLTIHAFYFPLNTPLTISLLSITDVETLPAHGDAENSGGMAGWLKYKNWGMSALSDIWWARDPQRSVTGAFMTSTMPSKSSGAGDKENAPPVHVVVRVKGEWLRKGFGVQDERGVKVLQDAWKSVKENEVGLKPLKSARGESGHDHEGNLAANKLMGDGANGGGGSEKRRWLNYQNTWTAYPFADDSPQFLAQQQRRGGSAVSVVGGLGSTLASKAMRYHQPLRPRKSASSSSGGVAVLGEDESCGDDPLFIDNDLNIHEEI
ncbi:hypothetical protein BGZ99_000203 [Dissophora globulifera]|uniref:Uncharacterized protein n=1 Tax=Dissophora globulifera TaxID=979702 RepID=A0A9P6RPY1_9FUNG|nr:hypothetical protein BGZ99_000203 [Dissophora globulifera]